MNSIIKLNNSKKQFLFFQIVVTRQVRIGFHHFGIRECYVRIRKDIRVDFIAGALAPARIIARRGTSAVDTNVQPEELETHGVPARIMSRRSTELTDRPILQYENQQHMSVIQELSESFQVTEDVAQHDNTNAINSTEIELNLNWSGESSQMEELNRTEAECDTTASNQYIQIVRPVPKFIPIRPFASAILQRAIAVQVPQMKQPQGTDENEEASEDAPNYATHPLQYIEYYKKKVRKILSERTNF